MTERIPEPDEPWAADGETEPTQPLPGSVSDPGDDWVPPESAPVRAGRREPTDTEPTDAEPLPRSRRRRDAGEPRSQLRPTPSRRTTSRPTASRRTGSRATAQPTYDPPVYGQALYDEPAAWGTAPMHVQPGAGPWSPTGALPGAAAAADGRVPGWLWPVVASLALAVGAVRGCRRGSGLRPADSEPEPVAVGTDPAPLPADNGSVAAVAQQLLPSTVQILASDGGDSAARPAPASCSTAGVTWSPTTTSSPTLPAARARLQIVDQSGNRFDATLVGRSPVYDLAVLYAPEVKELQPAALGSADELRVGEGVVAIGSPLGLTATVTSGIVSAVDRPVTTGSSADDTSYINAVQTDAAINPGNSGGPLVNLAGQVVGVNSAIATTGGLGETGNIGVGFAIPIEQVRTTSRQILRSGEARYPVIGATVQTGTGDNPEGAAIDEVLAGSPAARAGLRQDDLITAIDGQRVTDGIALIVAIRSHQPGETVELTVERGGQEQTVRVTLDSKVG